jgi:DNA mismatch repair protein MutS
VKAGLRVAICDQLEDPKMKNIEKRGDGACDSGVSMNDEVLHSKTNNFLASVFFDNKSRNFFLDVSTGSFLLLKEMQIYRQVAAKLQS